MTTPEFFEAEHEIEELKLEIDRHHRDFKRISEICDRTLTSFSYDGEVGIDALKLIRDIVG